MKSYHRENGGDVNDQRKNGNGAVSWKFVATISMGLVLGGMSWWIKSIDAQSDTQQIKIAQMEKSNENIMSSLSRIESKVDKIDDRTRFIKP